MLLKAAAKKNLAGKAVDDLGNLVAMCELLPTDPAPGPFFRSAGRSGRTQAWSLGLGSQEAFLFCFFCFYVWMFGLTGFFGSFRFQWSVALGFIGIDYLSFQKSVSTLGGLSATCIGGAGVHLAQ